MSRMWKISGNELEKSENIDMLNACWFIFTSITPGAGGGTIATTHMGRAVASAAALFGILLGSVTTAALGNLLVLENGSGGGERWGGGVGEEGGGRGGELMRQQVFAPSENTAIGVMMREETRNALRRDAVNMISLWWRRRKKKKLSPFQAKVDMFYFRSCLLLSSSCSRFDSSGQTRVCGGQEASESRRRGVCEHKQQDRQREILLAIIAFPLTPPLYLLLFFFFSLLHRLSCAQRRSRRISTP